jgi:hypothetical protein
MTDPKITATDKETLFMAEEHLSAIVADIRDRLNSGAVEQPAPLMLNRDAVLSYTRPHVVMAGHRLARLVTMRKRTTEPPPTENRFQALCQLLYDEKDFRSIAGASHKQNVRARYWRLVASFAAHAYRFHIEQVECASNDGDWSRSDAIFRGFMGMAACSCRLVAAGLMASLHLPEEWSARQVRIAKSAYPQLNF